MDLKIILADDDERWRLIVRDYLETDGYQVMEAENGLAALNLLRDNPDTALVIMDVMMPVMDGMEAVREIRNFSQVPILMVTAREDEETEISGFRSGVDQFISKPIKMRAFMERVRSVARRGGWQETIRIGELEIRPASGEVLCAGVPTSLRPKEYDLLIYLAMTPNEIRSREQILRAIWHTDFFGDGRIVDTQIKNLRMKLGPCGEMLRTVRSRGYMLEDAK